MVAVESEERWQNPSERGGFPNKRAASSNKSCGGASTARSGYAAAMKRAVGKITFMSRDIAQPAPPRLKKILRHWHTDHRRPQAGIGWSHRTWLRTLPGQHEFLSGLPDPLDRATVVRTT